MSEVCYYEIESIKAMLNENTKLKEELKKNLEHIEKIANKITKDNDISFEDQIWLRQRAINKTLKLARYYVLMMNKYRGECCQGDLKEFEKVKKEYEDQLIILHREINDYEQRAKVSKTTIEKLRNKMKELERKEFYSKTSYNKLKNKYEKTIELRDQLQKSVEYVKDIWNRLETDSLTPEDKKWLLLLNRDRDSFVMEFQLEMSSIYYLKNDEKNSPYSKEECVEILKETKERCRYKLDVADEKIKNYNLEIEKLKNEMEEISNKIMIL